MRKIGRPLRRWVLRELRETRTHPGRLAHLARPRHVRRVFLRLRREIDLERLDAPWGTRHGEGLMARSYRSYEEYAEHQRSKLYTLCLDKSEQRFRAELRCRLGEDGLDGGNALCLGARLGAEVRAFRDQGFFAVGIDLNPGKENSYVLHGDFHRLDFPDACVDVVFTNAFDHALEPHRLLLETKRVLKPGGHLILEVAEGVERTGSLGDYEALAWRSIEDLLRLVQEAGFRELRRAQFDYPWRGWHLLLEAVNDSG